MVQAAEYLNRKRVSLSDKMTIAQAELEELKREIARVDAAIIAIEGVDRKASIIERNKRQGRTGIKKHHQYSYKQLVVRVLKDAPQGLTAIEILQSIKNYYGIEIMRTSMSPQLSRLKGEGKLKLEGKTWHLIDEQTPHQTEFDIIEQSPDREGQG